jgi:hypothetical protein
MKRSGGRAGRPFGHVSIDQLESHVQASRDEPSELMAILAELGRRETRRAEELKSLVQRLLGEKARPPQKPHEF